MRRRSARPWSSRLRSSGSVGVYGFVIWLPSMLKAAGESSIMLVGWLSAGPYLAAAALMFIGSYFSDVSGNRKNFVWAFLLIGAVAFYGSYLLSHFLVAGHRPAISIPPDHLDACAYRIQTLTRGKNERPLVLCPFTRAFL
jgi:MFS family permease